MSDREYVREAAYYLARHPYCMIFIFRHELDEQRVIELRGLVNVVVDGERRVVRVPYSSEIHHRNKRNTEQRKLDQRWWMAACREQHDWVEDHKDVARSIGLLLPIQADEDGRWGQGNQALETPALLASHVR